MFGTLDPKSFASMLFTSALVMGAIAPIARAQDEEPEEPEQIYPTLTAEIGKPLALDMKDGRVAVLKKSVIDYPKTLDLGFQVFDNTCNDNRGMKCRFGVPARKIWYFFAWEKHPDSKKVGEVVVRKFSDDNDGDEATPPIVTETKLEGDYLNIGTEKAFMPKVSAGMSDAIVECMDFSWLPDQTTTAPASLALSRWDSELMTDNPETAMAENRTFGGFIDVSLSRLSPQQIKLDGFYAFSTMFTTPVAPLVGDVITWTMQTSAGDMCQAELKPGSIATVQNNLNNIDKMRPDPKHEKNVYVFGSDEFSKDFLAKRSLFMSTAVSALKDVSRIETKEFQ